MTHSTSRALGADPGEPLELRQSYSNAPGQTGVDPGKLKERTHIRALRMTSHSQTQTPSLNRHFRLIMDDRDILELNTGVISDS